MLIAGVLENSPAAKAGLKPLEVDHGRVHPGDVIVELDGKPVARTSDLFALLETHKPGDTVTLTVLRDGKRQDVPVTLAAIE